MVRREGVGFFAFRGGGSAVATGCGTVRPVPGKVPSYPAGAHGVLAMRALFAEHRTAGVDLYLGNKAVVDTLSTQLLTFRMEFDTGVSYGVRHSRCTDSGDIRRDTRPNTLDYAGGCESYGGRARGRRTRFDR